MATGVSLTKQGGHAPARIETLDEWFDALTQPTALTELAAVAGCVLLAWLIVRIARRARDRHAKTAGVPDSRSSILFGEHVLDGVLFPALLLCFGYIANALLARLFPLAVFKVVIPVLVSLFVIRLGVKVLQVAFKDAPLVRALERSISWGAWIAMVMWVSGLLPVILDELDDIKWKVGNSTMSVRTMLEGTITAAVVLLITLWISSAIESRLLRSATGSELSLRKAISNATRAVLMFVGLLLALSSVGIDLTALSVLGGAIGVGVGFGLQKLAASYVSGFVMLAERSVRIGDNVRVDSFEGRITDINARYTVVRAPSGRESIVPNEIFISNRIENLSLIDSRAQQTTVIAVGYDSDVALVQRLLAEAALAQPRVMKDPGPTVNLTNFLPDGLEFTLAFWLTGPETGLQTLRSQINIAVLQSLRAHNIDIPYPQRVIHTRVVQAADDAPPPPRPPALESEQPERD